MNIDEKFEEINRRGIACVWHVARLDSWSDVFGLAVAKPERYPQYVACGTTRDVSLWSVEQLAGHVSQLLYGGQELTQFQSRDDIQNQGKQLGAALRAVIDNPHDEQAVNVLAMCFSDMYGYDNKQQFMPFVSSFVAGFRGDEQKLLSSSAGL